MGSVEVPIPYTPAEWNRVASLIMSEDLTELEECHNYLRMWISRMGDRTPIAITCSSMFVMGAIKELQMKGAQNLTELKLFHGMTIIRFINYTSETMKDKDVKMSIVKSCALIGIPQWIVEIRHNSSHSHMPPIETLRKAVNWCFKWIYDNFWKKPMHEAIVTAGAARTVASESGAAMKLRGEIILNLNTFMAWRLSNMQVTNYDTTKNPILAAIQIRVVRDPHVFMSILVSSGYLIMNKEQLNRAGIYAQDNWKVPKSIQLLWAPVLLYMADAGLLGRFAEELLSAKHIVASEGRTLDEIQLTAWSMIVIGNALKPEMEMFSADEWTSILYKMIASPARFPTATIEKVIAKVPNVDANVRRQVRRIVSIALNDGEKVKPNASTNHVYTAADLERLMQEKARRSLIPERWGIFQAFDQFETPLPPQMGLGPGQTYDTVSLVLTPEWLAEADAAHERKLQAEKDRASAAPPEVVNITDSP